MEQRNSLLSQQIEQLKIFMLSKGYSSRALKYYTPSWNQLLAYANSRAIEYYTTEFGQNFLCEACGINLSSRLSTTEKKILRGVRLVETFLQDGELPNVCREKPSIPLQFILLRNKYADHLLGLGQKKKA